MLRKEMAYYTAFLLSQETRQHLLAALPAYYPEISADHITYEHGVHDFGTLFHPQKIEITGVIDDGIGMQALIVQVDGQQYRPNGMPYHITWSYAPEMQRPNTTETYRPIHANDLVEQALNHDHKGFTAITPPLTIDARPVLIMKQPDGTKDMMPLPRPSPPAPSFP